MRLSRPFSIAAATVSSSAAAAATLASKGPLNSSENILPWRHLTVEWSPKVAALRETKPDNFQAVTHLVFPDLPQVYTDDDRKWYLQSTAPEQRIQTLATCRHDTWQSLVATAKRRLEWTEEEYIIGASTSNKGKLLLVSGNDKTAAAISSIDAARILHTELEGKAELWGVADPNDPESIAKVHAKAQAGMTGFMTQPLLTSTSWNTIYSYPIQKEHNISLVVGMALPRSAQNLQFWGQLLDRPSLVENDDLFRSHLAYFSQPYTTSLAWIGREIQHCVSAMALNMTPSDNAIDGIHLMPLRNTDDLTSILKSLSRYK